MSRRLVTALAALALGVSLSAAGRPSPAIALTDWEVGLRTEMTGAEVVPGPGHATVSVDFWVGVRPSIGQMVYFYTITGLSEVSAIHIHSGGVGTNGPILFSLEMAPDGVEIVGSRQRVDRDLLQDMADNPAGYYVDVHTAALPDGAIRGQLERGHTWVRAWARGAEVVPGPGEATVEGQAGVRLDPLLGEACSSIDPELEPLMPLTSMAVHRGNAGENGPLVLALPLSTETRTCATGYAADALQAVIDDPAGHYVLLSTAAHPDGAVRGQLSHFNVGPPPDACPASTGVTCVLPAGTHTFEGLATALMYSTDIELLATQNGWAENGVHVPELGALGLEDPGERGALNVFAWNGEVQTDPCEWGYESIGTDPEDLIGWLARHPLLEVTDPIEVDYGGVPGLEVDVLVLDAPCFLPDVGLLHFRPGLDESVQEGTELRIIAQRVGSQTVLTVSRDFTAFRLEEASASTARVAGADAGEFLPVAQAIVDTFEWDVAAGTPPSLPDTAMPLDP